MTPTKERALAALMPLLGKPKFGAMCFTYWDHPAGSACLTERDTDNTLTLTLMPLCRQGCVCSCTCGVTLVIAAEGETPTLLNERFLPTTLSTIIADTERAIETLRMGHAKVHESIRNRLRKLNGLDSWVASHDAVLGTPVVENRYPTTGFKRRIAEVTKEEDAAFIADSPIDVEFLLQEVRLLQSAIRRHRDEGQNDHHLYAYLPEGDVGDQPPKENK